MRFQGFDRWDFRQKYMGVLGDGVGSDWFPVIHQLILEKTYAELVADEQEANINTQPFQYSVVPQHPQEEMSIAFEDKHCQAEDILELFQRLHNDVQNVNEELAVYINTPNWDRPTICYDDDDDEDYAIAVTPKSDEFIKSSVENLVPIPKESEGIPDSMCDVPFHDNSPPLDVLKDQFKDFSDTNDESISTDDDSLFINNIEYVEASPPDSELVSSESSSTSLTSLLEETNTFDNSLPESEPFCFDLEEISSGSTTTRYDISLLEYEAFYDDHAKEISSGRTTTHSDSSLYDSFIFNLSINPFPPADRSNFYEFTDELAHIISPSEYDCFCFKNEPNSEDFTMDVVENIFPTREPRVHNALPTIPPIN
nr:hypothetical protein [Tanacetum cinerariifolium]